MGGSSTPGGDAPGGSHPVTWVNNTFTGPGACQSNADCQTNYRCDYSSNRCEQCITDAHCARFSMSGMATKCVRNNGRRVCQYIIPNEGSPTPGVTPPDAIVDCDPQCQGKACVKGKCVECKDFNDCELRFSPSSSYSKVCNSTNQCNYVFTPTAGKTENRALIIGVATAVAVVVVILVAAVLALMYRKYKASNAHLQAKMEENKGATSLVNDSSLYAGGTTKRANNPLYNAQ
eukprot:Amastigsp_a508753_1296.p2 type:complete len:233 gc:universal Amastigsp_a508753_1296:720-22(-)